MCLFMDSHDTVGVKVRYFVSLPTRKTTDLGFTLVRTHVLERRRSTFDHASHLRRPVQRLRQSVEVPWAKITNPKLAHAASLVVSSPVLGKVSTKLRLRWSTIAESSELPTVSQCRLSRIDFHAIALFNGLLDYDFITWYLN